MENKVYSDELQHWGIRGQKWGIRRYQNSDGTLTPAGQKRYNKEVEKLKKETAKVKEAEKVAANRKKTQTKIDKLNSKKQELEDRKNALKDEKQALKDKKKAAELERKKQEEAESIEERRERLLKSTDAKELYKNKDLLTYNELNERINRIDMETRLKSKIVEEHHKTGLERMDGLTNAINKSTNLFRSVDSAASTVSNSFIGKTLMKKLGLEPPTKERESVADFVKNALAGKKNNKEIKEYWEAQNNIEKLKEILDKPKKEAERKAKKEAEEAEKKAKKEAEDAKVEAERQATEAKYKENRKTVDEYNERWQRGESDDKVGNSINDSSANAAGSRDTTKFYKLGDTHTERANTDGKIYGEGTSRFTGWQSDKKAPTYDASEGDGFRSVYSEVKNEPITSISTEVYRSGYERVNELLGDSSSKSEDDN